MSIFMKKYFASSKRFHIFALSDEHKLFINYGCNNQEINIEGSCQERKKAEAGSH